MSEIEIEIFRCKFMEGQDCKFRGDEEPSGSRRSFALNKRYCRQYMTDKPNGIKCDKKDLVSDIVKPVVIGGLIT